MLFPFFPKSKKHQKEINRNKKNDKCINIIKESLEGKENDNCFECGKGHPQYISINNSIFLCRECILNHLQLSQEASTIIKNDLKILTLNEIKYINNGGNQKLFDFIKDEFPKLKDMKPHIFYNTKAIDYYRKKLKYLTEGGEKPVKPIGDDAYTSILKNEEDEINDFEIEGNEPPGDELFTKNHLSQNNQNENNNNLSGEKNLKIKEKENIKNNEEQVNISNDNDEEKTNYKSNYKSSNKKFSDIKENNLKRIIDEENDNKIIKSSNKKKINFNNYNSYIKNNQLYKTIKKNYNNFDNENYNYSANKTSDTIEIVNTNLKNNSKENHKLNKINGILYPYPTSNNFQQDNQIKKILYSKPKGMSFFKKYKFRTKSDYSVINSNNEIDTVFNINEFCLDNKNKKLNYSRNRNIKNNDDYIDNITEKIKKTKINNYFSSSKLQNNTFENNDTHETYKTENKTIFQSNNKTKNTYYINSYKSKKQYLNENKNNEKENNKEKNDLEKHNISVNISHYKIINNINNYSINIDQIKSKKISNRKEKYNSLNNNSTDYPINKNQKIISDIEKEQSKNEEIKNEKLNENKKIIAKKLLNSKNNNKEDNIKRIPRNPIKNYEIFRTNRIINKEINLKYRRTFMERTNSSSNEKNYSFYDLTEKNKSRDKDIELKEKNVNLKNQELKQLPEQNKNKSMNEPYRGFVKESIRNKYKQKKERNFI